MASKPVRTIGDRDLNVTDIFQLGTGAFEIQLAPEAVERIQKAHDALMRIANSGRTIYGVNTGFGELAKHKVNNHQLHELQINLVRQSAAGVGPALSAEGVRRMLLLRINTICQGHSGARLETVQAMLDALNNNRLPLVPVQGTVGASGDLAPLSHLTLGVFGEGELICGDKSKITARMTDLGPKEGLALINGTQFITSLATEAIIRSRKLLDQAIIVAAMTIEALKGIPSAFDAGLHQARRHKGQRMVAERLRQLLPNESNKSSLFDTHHGKDHVQDAYSIRCIPQVLGVVYDTLQFVASLINEEINAVTDNPLVFEDREDVVSGGNFHGQYPAKAMDILAISVHDIGNMSERRTERMVNPNLSQKLPPFLTPTPGLSSGYMIAQYCSAALVSENKTLCHPASVDSIPTSANQEDHVSMGGWGARKVLNIIENVEHVVAIELLCACQALDLRKLDCKSKTLKTTPSLEAVYNLVRRHVPFLEEDRELRTETELVCRLLKEGQVTKVVEESEGRVWTCLQG